MSDETKENLESVNPNLEIEEEFRARVNALLDNWQANNINFSEALKQADVLRQEAVDENKPINEAGVYNVLGIMYGYRANYDESILNFTKARDIYEKHHVRRRVATCDLNLGETYRLRANYIKARQYFHSAYEYAKTINEPALQVTALTNEGQVWMSLKSLDKARRSLEDALEISRNIWQAENERDIVRRADNECEIHCALASVYLMENRAEMAWQEAIVALDLAKQIERPVRIGFANRSLGDVITALGEAPEEDFSNDPDSYYQAALDAFRQVKADGEVGKTLFAQGQSLAKRRKNRSAGQKLQQAMVIFTKLGMTEDAAKAAEAQMTLI